ncbi:MAG: hypothetical protein ACO1RX_01925 [Candidatus Sericytochromatia bacterium]
MSKMGNQVAAVALSLGLVACQSSPTTGALRFQFQAPNTNTQLQFQIQLIPANTTHFEISISGEGLSSARQVRVELQSGQTQTHTVGDLPTGSKTVTVTAFGNEKALARGQSQAVIAAGTTAQAEITLAAISSGVQIQLEQALPLDLDLELAFTGEGLNNPERRNLTLSAGRTQADVGALPPGSKKVTATLSTRISGATVSAPARTLDLEVDANGNGQLLLSVAELLGSFEDQLAALLNQVSPAQLLAILLGLGPERLNQLYLRLPPPIQAKILDVPELRAQITLPNSSPTPSPSPTPEPSPSVNTQRFLADARLVLQTPANPSLLQTQPLGTSIFGQIQALEADQTNVILGNGAWGLLVRVRSATGEFIPYALQLWRTNGAEQERVQNLNSDLRQQVSVAGETFQADAVIFNGDERIPLLPGNYEIRLFVKNPESQQNETYTFPLQVPAIGG